jgi:carbon monoxide dehydrogenase subunit G
MNLSGSRVIGAERSMVWAALNDAEVLKACIPGCQELTGTAADGFDAVVMQKVGPVQATFRGSVTLSDVVPEQSYHISGEGKGGASGFAKGGARVSLAAAGDGTELSYDVDAKVGGKLAQLGGRIVDGFAKKMADQFFERFQAAVEAPSAEDVDEAETAPADRGEPPKRKGWFRRLVE